MFSCFILENRKKGMILQERRRAMLVFFSTLSKKKKNPSKQEQAMSLFKKHSIKKSPLRSNHYEALVSMETNVLTATPNISIKKGIIVSVQNILMAAIL